MKKFEFSSTNSTEKTATGPLFSGKSFYNVYKDSIFLTRKENVEAILSKGYELRNMLKGVNPGERVALNGMMLKKNIPLSVIKTGPNTYVKNYEFTNNRLNGLVAAFAFENCQRFSMLSSTEAEVLGLTWDNQDKKMCRLFLSAVSGTEHFHEQFKYWPLVCALRKLQLNKITKEPVIKMAKIKNENGIRMAQDLINNFTIVKDLWSVFPGTSSQDLIKQLEICPPELKMLFKNNP